MLSISYISVSKLYESVHFAEYFCTCGLKIKNVFQETENIYLNWSNKTFLSIICFYWSLKSVNHFQKIPLTVYGFTVNCFSTFTYFTHVAILQDVHPPLYYSTNGNLKPWPFSEHFLMSVNCFDTHFVGTELLCVCFCGGMEGISDYL